MTNPTQQNIEDTESFGNRLIYGIDEILLPADISLLPTAPGWQALAVLVIIYLVHRGISFARLWFKNRYRQTALKALAELRQHDLSAIDIAEKLPFYLKATALQAYPREKIAAMSGPRWLDFLDQQCEDVDFSGSSGVKLLDIAYKSKLDWDISVEDAEALIQMSQFWIKHHHSQPLKTSLGVTTSD